MSKLRLKNDSSTLVIVSHEQHRVSWEICPSKNSFMMSTTCAGVPSVLVVSSGKDEEAADNEDDEGNEGGGGVRKFSERLLRRKMRNSWES